MPGKGPRISRARRSAAAAIVIGLLAPLLILNAAKFEALARGQPEAASAQPTAVQGVFDRLDTLVYDYLFQLRGPHVKRADANGKPLPSISEVAIVTLDANSIDTVNDLYKHIGSHGPPYPRRVYADLVRKLKRAGAAVIGIDVVFATPSGYNRSRENRDDDREFAAALKQCGNVVLAAEFNPTQLANGELVAQRQDFPIPELAASARAVCPVNVPKDNLDNELRRFHLTQDGPEFNQLGTPIGTKPYVAFGPMIAALYWKQYMSADPDLPTMPADQFDPQTDYDLTHGLFAGRPVYFHRPDSQALRDPDSINICYAGYPGPTTCAIRSLGQVLDKNESELGGWFRDRVVLIGNWNATDQDFYSTPLIRRVADSVGAEDRQINEINAQVLETEGDHRYGVEVHANIIHTLLAHHIYRDFEDPRRIALVWLCSLITALLVARLKPVLALFPIAALLLGIALIVTASFSYYVFLRPVQIGLAAICAYGLESVYFYSVESRSARRARTTFQRYVGPKVMERVLDTDFKPGTVEQRHLTIMFTDVQGFTSLSEKMSPREVVETFNRYLNEMVDIIDKHGGTLDKIMGDGVMAYFNAPLPVEHHEQKAVECALDMQAAMRSWRELSESLGLPPLKVRIGINSGDVVFGEVGAKRQLGYTVIGDAVNTAARLEPLNKEFGTEILISEAVLNQLDGTFETHYVGELAIRGREEGIRAYSVTGHKTTPHAS